MVQACAYCAPRQGDCHRCLHTTRPGDRFQLLPAGEKGDMAILVGKLVGAPNSHRFDSVA